MNHNTLLEIIKSRRSIRKFKSHEVPKDKIRSILEAGCWAPSFANSQPWNFIVVDDPALKERMFLATAHHEILEAPASIIVTVDPEKDMVHHILDGANATMNMLLMAHYLKLGAVWVGVLGLKAEDLVKEALNIPPNIRVISIIPIGEAAEFPSSTRKNLEELVFWNTYGFGGFLP